MVRNNSVGPTIASTALQPLELGSMEQCYAALPYLLDFEAGQSFRKAQIPRLAEAFHGVPFVNKTCCMKR